MKVGAKKDRNLGAPIPPSPPMRPPPQDHDNDVEMEQISLKDFLEKIFQEIIWETVLKKSVASPEQIKIVSPIYIQGDSISISWKHGDVAGIETVPLVFVVGGMSNYLNGMPPTVSGSSPTVNGIAAQKFFKDAQKVKTERLYNLVKKAKNYIHG